MKLSIIIPCFNEERTLQKIIQKIMQAGLEKGSYEIIVVDDYSTDGTRAILNKIQSKTVRVFFHERNKGKGAAIKKGISHARGDIILIQDADLEYDPNDYHKILPLFRDPAVIVVYGSRYLNKKNKNPNLAFFFGVKLLNFVTNVLFLSRLTDEATCYKVFRKPLFDSMTIKGDRFEWEPEFTAKILKRGIKIWEVPISYYPRSIEEGKKIRLKDGIQALWTLFKYRVRD